MCAMPNLNPVPDSWSTCGRSWTPSPGTAGCGCIPMGPSPGRKRRGAGGHAVYGALVCSFSDDGKGVQSADQMRDAMELAKQLDKPITAHCETSPADSRLVHPRRKWAKRNGFPGNAPERWKQVERDLELVRRPAADTTCHVSTKESVALIRKAKAEAAGILRDRAPT